MSDNWKDGAADRLCDALLTLENREEAYAFLEDIATIGEIKALAQRLELARILTAEAVTYPEIARRTGASTATISRVKRCLDYGADGYRLVLGRLKNGEDKLR